MQFSRACATLDLQVGQCICTGFAHLELPQSRTDGGAGAESRACAPLDLELARAALDLEVHFMLLQALVISPTQGRAKKKWNAIGLRSTSCRSRHLFANGAVNNSALEPRQRG